MAQERSSLFSHIKESIISAMTLSAGGALALASKVSDTLFAPTREPLVSLSNELSSILRVTMEAAPEEARKAASGESGGQLATKAAFALGQLMFAQTIVNQAASRRADERFVRVLKSTRYKELLRALAQSSYPVTELSKIVGETKEHTSRKLSVLRGHGVVGFQKDGTKVFNFLMPDAKAAIEDLKIFDEYADRKSAQQIVVISYIREEIKGATTTRFRDHQTFGGKTQSRDTRLPDRLLQ